MTSIEHHRTYKWKKMNSLSLDSSFFFFFSLYIYVCVLLFCFSLFTGSLEAFIHRVCARPSFFFVARWVTSRKEETTKKKKLERMDWCIGEYTIKKKQKKKKRPRREKTKLSVNAREEKKERWEETGWSISIIGMRTTRKRCHQSGEKKRRDGKKLYSHSTEKKEREKKCVYTESGQQHVPPNKSHCIHFPVIRASSSSRLHIYIYII